jgi:hypothetical protein
MQMGREPRGPETIRTIAFACITRESAREELREPRLRSGFAGAPGGAKAAVPGNLGQQIEGLEGDRLGPAIRSRESRRGGERRGWLGRRETAAPERREDAERCPTFVEDRPGLVEQGRVRALGDETASDGS